MNLADVIAEVESHHRDISPRFEPLLYAQWGSETLARTAIVNKICAVHFCDRATARMLACTSWGRYQILGENLYSICGVDLTIFAYVADVAAQDQALNCFLDARGINFAVEDLLADPVKREQFITRWNGPGNVQGYWNLMQAAIKALGGPTIVDEQGALA